MQNITRLVALAALATCTLLSGACATRVERIEDRQDVRTSGVERRHDRYDARYSGRQDRRDIRSERADARYDRW
jgi:hypothetical protein